MSKSKLTDRQKIDMLKAACLGLVASNVVVIAGAYSAIRAYEKGRAESIRGTLNRIFEVVQPTSAQLEEIKALIEFDHDVDDFLSNLK